MKNKLLKVSIFFPLIFMLTPNVNAECNDKELNDLAEKIEIKYSKYEVKKGEDDLGFAYVLTATPYNEKISMMLIMIKIIMDMHLVVKFIMKKNNIFLDFMEKILAKENY